MNTPSLKINQAFNSNLSPYPTNSWSKTSGSLTLCCIMQALSGSEPALPDLSSSGDGLTWAQEDDFTWSGSSLRLTTFRTVPGSSGSVTTTFAVGGATLLGGGIYILEFDTDADSTGTNGDNGVVQAQSTVAYSGTVGCGTLAAFGSASNGTLFFGIGKNAGGFTAGGGVSDLSSQTLANTTTGVAWATGGHRTPTYTFSSGIDWNMGGGIEIKAAAAGGGVTLTQLIRGSQRGMQRGMRGGRS